MTLRTGVAEATLLAPGRSPGSLLATNEITICPPSSRHVQVGGLRLTPSHEILAACSSQWPELLPLTFTIVIPAGGTQLRELMNPIAETFETVTRY